MDSTAQASGTQTDSCINGPLAAGDGVATRTVTLREGGWVTARLSGGGDWDLAMFGRGTGRRISGAAGFGGREVAQGAAIAGTSVLVQAWRRSGSDATAALELELEAVTGTAEDWTQYANRRGRRVTDGYYFARYRLRTPAGEVDSRRIVLRRVNGRFSVRPAF